MKKGAVQAQPPCHVAKKPIPAAAGVILPRGKELRQIRFIVGSEPDLQPRLGSPLCVLVHIQSDGDNSRHQGRQVV